MRRALEGARKVEDAAKRRAEGEDDVHEPSSTCKEVEIWKVEEVYSLIGGLCQLSKEAKAAAN